MKKHLLLLMAVSLFTISCQRVIMTEIGGKTQQVFNSFQKETFKRKNLLVTGEISKEVAEKLTNNVGTKTIADTLTEVAIDRRLRTLLANHYDKKMYKIETVDARYDAEGAARYVTRWALPLEDYSVSANSTSGGSVEKKLTKLIVVTNISTSEKKYYDAVRICPPPSPCANSIGSPIKEHN